MQRVVLLLIVLVAISCESRKKTIRMADEFCECFQPVNIAVSAETLKIYEQLSGEEEITKVYDELKTTDSVRAGKVRKELSRFDELMRTKEGPTGCLIELQFKYGVDYLDEAGQVIAIVKHLKTRSDCRAAVAFLRVRYRIK
jgi:hypothetical protein